TSADPKCGGGAQNIDQPSRGIRSSDRPTERRGAYIDRRQRGGSRGKGGWTGSRGGAAPRGALAPAGKVGAGRSQDSRGSGGRSVASLAQSATARARSSAR